jgi:hypothetical protein
MMPLVEHLNQMREAEPETAVRRPKGPRTKKITDEGRWTKLPPLESEYTVESEYQPVSYIELPTLMRVERLPVRLFLREHKGRPQWQGQYRLYHKGDKSDYMDVVVNVPRLVTWPIDGVWYWVRPLSMAPKTWLVFAELIREIDHSRDFCPEPALLYEDDKAESKSSYRSGWDEFDRDVYDNCERPDYD